MKILLVNVNTSTAATDAMVAAGRRTADSATEIVGVTPEFGSTGVDSNTQSLLAAVATGWALGIPLNLIGAGAEAFEADLQAALASLQLSQTIPSPDAPNAAVQDSRQAQLA